MIDSIDDLHSFNVLNNIEAPFDVILLYRKLFVKIRKILNFRCSIKIITNSIVLILLNLYDFLKILMHINSNSLLDLIKNARIIFI